MSSIFYNAIYIKLSKISENDTEVPRTCNVYLIYRSNILRNDIVDEQDPIVQDIQKGEKGSLDI